MRPPTIGELDHRLGLEAAARTVDDGGGALETWSRVAEVWAQIRAVRGYETFVAHGLSGRVTHEVWIRYRADVGPQRRLVDEARVFDIRAAIDPDGRRTWLRCLCEVTTP
jgi:SPP1 family predicted phage head-tail adaptor